MSIVKRSGSNNWYVQFQLNGKTYIKSSKTTDKRIAEILEGKWKSEIIRSEYLGEKEQINLHQALEQLTKSKNHLASLSTQETYETMIKANFIGNPNLDSITNREILKFYHQLKVRNYSASTMRHLMNYLKQSTDLAKKTGYLTPNLDYPKISVKPTKLRYLSVEEERRLIESLNPYRSIRSQPPYSERKPTFNQSQHQHHDFVVMLLDTGARFSEIAKIEWNAIDLETKTIRLWRPKVRNESILYMTDRLYAILLERSLHKTTRYVFTSKEGQPMKYVPRMWTRIFKRAGLDGVSAHTLRHTLASRLVQSGLSIYEVKEILGHSDIKTTMRYSHLERVDAMKKAKDVLNALNLIASQHKSCTSESLVGSGSLD